MVCGTFFENLAGIYESNLFRIEGDLVDRISKNDRWNSTSQQGTLAQPLELKESLKIRDGLGGHDVCPAQWPQFVADRLITPDWSYWVSNN